MIDAQNGHRTLEENMADWTHYAEQADDDEQWPASPDPLRLEIQEENQRALRRQRDFRRAAEYVAAAFREVAGVRRVALFGSVAKPLQEETPRFRKYRRSGLPMLHQCKDIDLAVWLDDLGKLKALQKARSRALNRLLQDHGIGVAHHQVDMFIMDPATDHYLGRLCTFGQCPRQKPPCWVTDCGKTPLLRQHEDFSLDASALAAENIVVLV